MPIDIRNGDASSVIIKISPALKDVSLADLLEAITKTADKPIRYTIQDVTINHSIQDTVVVFSLRGPEPIPLEIRTYHVDQHNVFLQDPLESISGFSIVGDIAT